MALLFVVHTHLDPSLFVTFYVELKRKSKECTVDNQTECSTWTVEAPYGLYEGCVSPLTWSERQSGNPRQYLRSQALTLKYNAINTGNEMRCEEWSINTSGPEGGRFINQSCLFRFWLYKSTYNGRTRGHVSNLLFYSNKNKFPRHEW